MKKLNRIFMYIMMLFIFSHFSFSENENTEILLKSRRKEPAKLTIGVTKLKTKELLLDFDAEKKIIYGELPQGFDDNKLIFVSETLDEIPSLTVSGNKRKVNNIEKYFARNVKSAPKFIYEIVAGNGENGAEEGKKYLVIKCKTNISGVYVYVLEKESYKIKDVYRGKFERLYTTQNRATTNTITIENPIVQFEKDGDERNLGRVFINGTSAQTVDKSGTNYDINGKWISGDATSMYFNTGNYNIEIKSPDAQSTNDGPVFGGTSARFYVDLKSKNETMWQVIGTEKKLVYGVHTYDFIGGTYTLTLRSYDKSSGKDYQTDTFTVKFPEFDGTVYLDKTLDIGNQNKYEKQYEIFSAENGKILLGSVGLRELDRRITYEQNGGDGVSVRLLTQDVILKKEKSEYIIKGTLTIEDDNALNNEVRGENREDTTARKGNVYLTLSKSEEEKLAGGGKYHILTADGQDPLVVGVKADTGTFLNTAAQLWLVTDEKYSKVNIKFKNDEMPLKEDENIGWINYLTGKIEGYTGNWGEITGQITEIPEGTTAIYLLDENGKTLSSGKDWQNDDILIGESKVTIKYDGNSIHFGVKEGNYKVGEEGKFFLRYVDETNKKYLKIEEVNVEFILNKLTSRAEVRFKNPMMKADEAITGVISYKGLIKFGKNTPKGEALEKGNHSFTKRDAEQWWEVSDAGEYDLNSYKYKIYDETGYHTDFEKGKAEIWIKGIGVNGTDYNFSFSVNKELKVGVINYSGKRTENTFYLAAYDENDKPVRCDEVKIIIDEFDPNAYGKIVPANNNITEDNKAGEVGTGTENLKEEVTEDTLIDLATNFRFYSRFRGIINAKGETAPFVLNWENDVIIKSKTENQDVIYGQLVLVEEKNENNEILNNRLAMEEQTDISASIPEYYRLKVKLSRDEYKKLKTGTHYQIFKADNNSNDYHVMKIGVENENSPWYENLNMNEPLNFKTSGASIEIIPDKLVLDFGKINVNENHGKDVIREGHTFVTIIGREIKDFEVTPNIDKMGETEIFLTDTDDNQDQNVKLQVSRLKAEKVFEEQTDQHLKRIYNFNGIVTVPPDSEIGEYTGETVINVTVIDE